MQYTVRSDHFRSEVTRRYSDFQALADLLLYRCWVLWGLSTNLRKVSQCIEKVFTRAISSMYVVTGNLRCVWYKRLLKRTISYYDRAL